MRASSGLIGVGVVAPLRGGVCESLAEAEGLGVVFSVDGPESGVSSRIVDSGVSDSGGLRFLS